MRRQLLPRSLLATCCALMLLLAFVMTGFVSPHLARAASATHQLSQSTKAGRPHVMKTRRASKTTSSTVDNVSYHNGRVMQQTSITYAIFWEPSTLPDGTATQVSANYHSLLERYLGDVGGSGLYNNNTQYYDNFTGHITNSSNFGGAWIDSSSYPAADCTDAATPHGCLTDTDIIAEINNALAANPGWSNGYTHLFLVFTSWGEGSCTDASSTTCAFAPGGYCAYHSAFYNSPTPFLYAAIPYAGTDLADCGVPTSPNNDMDTDSAINLVSHEQMAAVTNPVGDGWYDSQSFDIADKCNFVFGPLTLDGGLADVQWNGHFYVVQEQWSNASAQCVLSESGALLKSTVYVGADDTHIYAFDALDGSVRWSYQLGTGVQSSPAVANGVVYVGDNEGEFDALNASTGKRIWNIGIGQGIYSSPIVVNKILYLGNFDGHLYALNTGDGSLHWQYATGGSIRSAPQVVNGVVYFGSNDSNIYALNARHGALLWKYATGDSILSSPTVVNGVVYVGSTDSKVYALNASSGNLLWSYTTNGPINQSSPRVVNGVVYIGSSDGNLYALNASNGSLKWASAFGGAVNSSPQVVGSVVYVGSDDGNLYALNVSNGTQRWHYTTGGGASSPRVVSGVIFVGGDDYNVYALNASNGTLKWSYTTGYIVETAPVVSTAGY